MEAAVSDFVLWEPGESLVCVLCGQTRGGDDPPGIWFRSQPSCRRRIPILGADGDASAILGWFTFILP